jgi:hypothetical protein
MFVGRQFGLPQFMEQQRLVAGIDERVYQYARTRCAIASFATRASNGLVPAGFLKEI